MNNRNAQLGTVGIAVAAVVAAAAATVVGVRLADSDSTATVVTAGATTSTSVLQPGSDLSAPAEQLQCANKCRVRGTVDNARLDLGNKTAVAAAATQTPDSLGEQFAARRGRTLSEGAKRARPSQRKVLYDNVDKAAAKSALVEFRSEADELTGVMLTRRNTSGGWQIASFVTCSNAPTAPPLPAPVPEDPSQKTPTDS